MKFSIGDTVAINTTETSYWHGKQGEVLGYLSPYTNEVSVLVDGSDHIFREHELNRTVPDIAMPLKCCKEKDTVILSLAERCKGQSELLGKRAEKTGFVGDPRFHACLKEMGDLHDERQKGYGTKTDPFANVRASEGWGISPWMGAMIRGCDKIRRLQTFAQTGELAGERVEDAFLDLANYAVIALVLYREGLDSQKGAA